MSATTAPLGEMTESELRAYDARYSTAEVEALGKKGQAFKNPDGHYSFPIANETDLSNAIQALGRAPDAVRDAVKAYIKRRASALGATDKLPESWRSAEQRDVEVEVTVVEDDEAPSDECASCEGTGSVNGEECTACDGSGDNPALNEVGTERAADTELEWRKKKAEQLTGRALERRFFDAEKLEIREDQDGGWTLTGYASVTESPYDVGFYTERIARGAFKRTLKNEPDVSLLLNHGDGGSGLPLARTKGGTLTIEEDRSGLYVEASLDPLDPDAQLLRRKMARGDLDGQMSFAFQAIDQDWNDDFSERTLKAVEINRGDVSIVTQGANPATSSTIRSLQGALDETVAIEHRAGRVLSSANVEELRDILSLSANADENLDQIQEKLARLLGVANPDDESENQESDGQVPTPIVSMAADGRSALDGGVMPDFTVRARQKYEALMKGRR